MRRLLGTLIAYALGLLVGIAVGWAACSTAHAGEYQDQHGEWWDLRGPPPRYFDKPYEGTISRNFLPEREIDRMCSGAVGHYERFGCAFVSPFRCNIYISSDLPRVFRNAVHYHEVAHCFGWPMHHPQR